MINTYEAYLKQPDALKMEDALRIYTEMTECISKCSAEDKIVNGKYFSIKKGILFSRNAANYFP